MVMTARFRVLWRRPDDPASFERDYAGRGRLLAVFDLPL